MGIRPRVMPKVIFSWPFSDHTLEIGSMMVATDGLYLERKSVFQAFAYGLAATISSVVLCVWLLISPEAVVICMGVTIYTVLQMYKKYVHVMGMFCFNEEETVDFEDLFSGPGAIKVVKSRKGDRRNGSSKSRKKYRRDDHYSDSDSTSSSSEEIEQSNHSNASGRVRNRRFFPTRPSIFLVIIISFVSTDLPWCRLDYNKIDSLLRKRKILATTLISVTLRMNLMHFPNLTANPSQQ